MPDIPVSLQDHYEIERFLHHEAALLDRRAYQEWLALLTPDIIYRVDILQIRDAIAGPHAVTVIEEDAAGLKSRVAQLANPRLTHAENPPSLTRRFVTNLQTHPGGSFDLFLAHTNILIHRNRPDDDRGRLYAGERQDILVRAQGQFRLKQRMVRLDHQLLHGGSISLLF